MKRRHAGLLSLSLLVGCGGAKVFGGGGDDGDDDDGATASTDADSIDPKDPNGGICKTLVAESYPEQITTTCTMPEGTSLSEFKLDPAPVVASIKVLLDGTDTTEFTYVPDTGFLQLNADFTGTEVKILYTQAHTDGALK